MADLNVKVGLDKSGFQTGLASMENAVSALGGRIGGALLGAFGFGAIISGFKNLVSELDKVANTARAFGVNAEDFQKFQYAIEQTGGSAESLARSLKTLAAQRATALGDDASNAAKAFEMLGISSQQLKDIKLADLFQLTRNRLSEISNESDRAAVSQEVLGKASLGLASSLEASSQQFDGFVRQAKVASEAAVQAGDAIDDAFTALSSNLKSNFSNIVEFFSPLILGITAWGDLLVNRFARIRDLAGAIGSAGVTLLTEGPRAALQDFNQSAEAINKKAREDLKRAGEIFRGEIAKPAGSQEAAQRNVDVSKFKSDEIRQEEALEKASLRSRQELIRAEDRYREAVRQRQTQSLDAAQQIGQAEAELADLQAQAAALAENTAQKFEALADVEKKRLEILQLQNRTKEDALRLAEQEARAADRLKNLRSDLELFKAENQGDQAVTNLLRQRAESAVSAARESGKLEDAVAAKDAVSALQRQLASSLRDEGASSFFKTDPMEEARRLTASLVAQIPNASEFSLTSLPAKTEPLTAPRAPEIIVPNLQEMTAPKAPEIIVPNLQEMGPQGLRDQQAGLSDIGMNEMIKTLQDGPKNGTILEIRSEVKNAVNKLEELIRASSTFGI